MRRTKGIECLQAALRAGLFPECIFIQAMPRIPIHYESDSESRSHGKKIKA